MTAKAGLRSIKINSCIHEEFEDNINTNLTMPFEERLKSFDFNSLFK
jgi:hypothetical protein